MVVLDTCAIIELCKEKPLVAKSTLKQIKDGAYIPSIVFAEIACKHKIGKLKMDISPKSLYEEYLKIEKIQFVDIAVEHWLDAITLDWPDNKDPADCLIVAFAKAHNIAIVTSDKKIKKFYKNVLW